MPDQILSIDDVLFTEFTSEFSENHLGKPQLSRFLTSKPAGFKIKKSFLLSISHYTKYYPFDSEVLKSNWGFVVRQEI